MSSLEGRRIGTWLALVGLPALAVAMACAGPSATAAPEDAQTIQGVVERFTTAPRGEVDGLVLKGGAWLHWPPHLQERFKDFAAKGDRVRARGTWETGPEGDTKLEVASLTNLRTGKVVQVEDAPPPPKGPKGKGPKGKGPRGKREEDREFRTVRGIVERVTTAPKGEVDGAVLEDGSRIHWPPHMQETFSPLAGRGERVEASGWYGTTPRGDTHLEVRSLTNLRSKTTRVNEDAPPAPASAARGLKAAPEDREKRLKAVEAQLEELLREVRRLRSDDKP